MRTLPYKALSETKNVLCSFMSKHYISIVMSNSDLNIVNCLLYSLEDPLNGTFTPKQINISGQQRQISFH